MNYAEPRTMDPRGATDTEETLAERLNQALSEDNPEETDNEKEPVVFGFFDETWLQPFDKYVTSRRVFVCISALGRSALDASLLVSEYD